MRCVRYICGVREVLGDFKWYAFGRVFCCVCVCFDLGVRVVSDVLCDVCGMCRACLCLCVRWLNVCVVGNFLCAVVWFGVCV